MPARATDYDYAKLERYRTTVQTQLMRWTPEQRAAIEHGDGLLAVVAGAGSGKTGVLTERFVYLVAERGVAPESILTITFTRTATAEMKTRIIRKLEQRGLREARTRIESAYIHTVHALCRRLLQENPFEAGIDPEPNVLPSPAANHLKREAFHRALARLLKQPRDFETDPLIDLISDYLNLESARGDPLQALYELVNKVAESTRHQGLTVSDLRRWAQHYPSAEALAVYYLRQAALSISPPAGQATVFAQGDVGTFTLQDLQAYLEQLARGDRATHHLRSLTSGINIELEQRARDIALALLQLTIEYLEAYEELKQAQGVLDFDDMQIRALQMLRQSATVRHRYQRLFQYTLVDETQDIDALQAQIIDILSAGGNLMVVGDAQQSIYGFRYADPRVFENWQEHAHRNGGQVVRLQANFRSHPDILAFVQLVFEHLWGERYLVLQPTRPNAPSYGEARVQVWRLRRRDTTYEAQLVASQIHHWVVNQSLIVHDPETGAERPARYGDFALLFHQFSRVDHFERAFHEVGVPYYVVGGGRGYWTQYEVRDLINLLRALSDAEDDLALLCVLRSPFVGLSMDALMTLALRAEQTELPIRLCLEDESDLDPSDAQRLREFREWFEPLTQRVGIWSVGAILARALEASQYEAKLLSHGEAGRQAVANVRKLLQMALDQPTTTPYEFAQQLELTTRLEHREGNAPTYEETADVVRFYTVHSAKGLEFPVVFVVDTGFRPNRGGVKLYVDADIGVIALQVVRPDHPTPYHSLPLRYLAEQAERNETAESLRTLYVALTRARDYLIVALTDEPHNPWCKGLRGALARYLDRNATHIPLPNGSVATLQTVN
ncbi:MAG: UvrD-helicase domain-containing protein [Armatimonadota bacterium]|nr:UvrD-helicase domain-containing protein [Armatimonadota bacterium]